MIRCKKYIHCFQKNTKAEIVIAKWINTPRKSKKTDHIEKRSEHIIRKDAINVEDKEKKSGFNIISDSAYSFRPMCIKIIKQKNIWTKYMGAYWANQYCYINCHYVWYTTENFYRD